MCTQSRRELLTPKTRILGAAWPCLVLHRYYNSELLARCVLLRKLKKPVAKVVLANLYDMPFLTKPRHHWKSSASRSTTRADLQVSPRSAIQRRSPELCRTSKHSSAGPAWSGGLSRPVPACFEVLTSSCPTSLVAFSIRLASLVCQGSWGTYGDVNWFAHILLIMNKGRNPSNQNLLINTTVPVAVPSYKKFRFRKKGNLLMPMLLQDCLLDLFDGKVFGWFWEQPPAKPRSPQIRMARWSKTDKWGGKMY